MASTAVTAPNRFVTPMISTSGAAAPAALGATDPTIPLVVSGGSVVREAVNGGPRASVPVADQLPCSRATGSLHRRGEPSARQRDVCANLAGALARTPTMDDGPEPILQGNRSRSHPTRRTPVVTELQLGTRIRSLRQARHLTLREVADRAGVTESFLSQVERDVTSPSIATVHRVARALGLSIAQLFAEEAEPGRVV